MDKYEATICGCDNLISTAAKRQDASCFTTSKDRPMRTSPIAWVIPGRNQGATNMILASTLIRRLRCLQLKQIGASRTRKATYENDSSLSESRLCEVRQIRACSPVLRLAGSSGHLDKLKVFTDARPDHPYEGQIGFISPRAEFTPKNVETTDLRTSLVYRLRIVIANPDEGLRQGMPVTAEIDLNPPQ